MSSNKKSWFGYVLESTYKWYQDRLQMKSNRAVQNHFTGLEGKYGIPYQADPRPDMLAERNSSTVAAGIARVTDTIKRLPLKVMEVEVEDGTRNYTPDDSHPSNGFLEQPNAFNNIGDIKDHLTQATMLAGNSYLGFDNFVKGIPTEFYPLHSFRTRLRPDGRGMPRDYVYTVQSKQIVYKLNEILHAKVYNINDPFYGRSRIEPLHIELMLDQHVKDYNKKFFKNNATPAGLIFPDNPEDFDGEQLKKFSEEWKEKYGNGEHHQVGVFPIPGKFEPFTPPLKDLAFNELLRLNREQILALLGTPPALVGIYEYANYANAEVQKKLFYENAILPMIAIIEAALNAHIMWRFYDKDHVYKFDLSGVHALQEDSKLRAETDSILVKSNIMTINEVRMERGLEPVEWGDEPTVSQNYLFGEESVANSQGGKPADSEEGEEPNDDRKGFVVPFLKSKATSPDLLNWKRHDANLKRAEAGFVKVLKPYFSRQLETVLDNLLSVTNQGKTMYELFWQIKSMERFITKADDDLPDDPSRIFDLKAEETLYAEVSIPYIRKTIETAGERALMNYTIDLAFNVNNPEVKASIQSFFNRSKILNETTYKKLQSILQRGYDERWSIAQLEKEIRNEYKFISKVRSQMIAQTEMNGVVNRGSRLAYQQAGLMKHQWLATFDSNTRDTHAYLNGEIVELGKMFTNGLKEPGDPNGTAAEVINCRCTTVPVLEE